MKERIILKITSARWLIAILLSLTLCYLAITDKVDADIFVPIVTLAIGYYFNKNSKEEGETI